MNESPYKGLIPYAEEDAPLFFGRGAEREIITANLMASRLTLLYGESGVGKSSVLRAGVAADLRRQSRRSLDELGTPESVVVVFSAWRDDPVGGIAAAVREAIADLFGSTIGDGGQALTRAERNLAGTLQTWTETVDADLLITLDQFEEYFLYHGTEDGPGTFAVEFPRAVNRPDLRVNFLVAIREDALAKLDRFKGRIANLFDNYLRIEHLDREAARAAITGPVEEYNRRHPDEEPVRIEPALVEAVLDQVTIGRVLLGEAGQGAVDEPARSRAEGLIETPYLQLVLVRLWEEEAAAGSRVLRLATLERLGGAERIVRTHLDGVMGSLPLEEQDVAARVFRHLVTLSGTKIAHTVSDLADYAGVPAATLEPVLEKLSGSGVRILRPVAPAIDRRDEPRYEIFHDVLAAAIADWRVRYAQARERAEAEARLAQERGRVNRLRAGVAALSLLLLVMAGLVIFALQQRAEARDAQSQAQRAEAEALDQQRVATVRELSAASASTLPVDPELSILLALQAVSISATNAQSVLREAQEALHAAVQASRVQRTMSGHDNGVFAVAISPDGTRMASVDQGSVGQSGTAHVWDAATGRDIFTLDTKSRGNRRSAGVAFSPDGRRLATIYEEATVRIWDATTGQPVLTTGRHPGTPSPNGGPVLVLAFAPDGGRLLTGGNDNTAKLWDATTGQELLTLSGHSGPVLGVSFSADGTRIATTSVDRTAKIWDAATGQELRTFSGHADMVNGAVFSPDGARLVTVSSDTTGRVWDIASGQMLARLLGNTTHLVQVALSADGARVATASEDGFAKVWDAASGQVLLTLAGHTSAVLGVALAPDGTGLATGSRDRTVRLWDISVGGGREWLVLSGHTDIVTRIAISKDGTRIATSSGDMTVKIWDAASGALLRTTPTPTGGATGIAFSPDGVQLATASADGAVKLWDMSTGRELTSLSHEAAGSGPIGRGGLVFTPDGKRLLGATGGTTAAMWDLTSGTRLFTISGAPGLFQDLAISPDGRYIIGGTHVGDVKLWDASTGHEVSTLKGQAGANGVAFSPDGRRAATAGGDGTVKVWDVPSGEELRAFTGHTGGLFGVDFSPDGRLLTSSGLDSLVKIWDLSAAGGRTEEPLTLTGHRAAVFDVTFSPDGRRVLTASRDRTSRVYALPIEDLVALARQRLTRGLTQQECQKYLHVEQCPPAP